MRSATEANHTRELEAKFLVAPQIHPALFTQPLHLDGYMVAPVGTITQLDTYMDTPAYELLRRGVALRVRSHASTYEVGIKSLEAANIGAAQSRIDIATPLAESATPLDATTWPAATRKLLASYGIKAAQLRPTLVIRQQRAKAKLSLAGRTQPLAEWSLDEVWINSERGLGQSPPSERKPLSHLHFYELEIELLETSAHTQPVQEREAEFDTLVSTVREQFELIPLEVSKYVRGLHAAMAALHADHDVLHTNTLTATMTLAQAAKLLLHQQLLQILLIEHDIRNRNRARDVHDTRVAIRRARVALHLAQHLSNEEIEMLEKGFKRLSGALGVLRDLDVALGNLRAFRRGQPAALQPSIQQLRAELKQQRTEAHADLLALLDSKKHHKFIAEALDFCTPTSSIEKAAKTKARNRDSSKGNWRAYEVTPTQLRHTLPSRIVAAFEAVRAYETLFNGASMPHLETFHALRIRAKYLRYLLEFVEHLLGDEGRYLVKRLRDLQEDLGALNDAYVERSRLQQWHQSASCDALLHQAIGVRLDETQRIIDLHRTATPAKLAALTSLHTRQTLAKALAYL